MNDNGRIIEIGEYSETLIDATLDFNKTLDLDYLTKPCFRGNKTNFRKGPYKVDLLSDNTVRIENTSYSGIIQLDKVRLNFSTKVKTALFYMLSFLRDEENFYYDPEVTFDLEEGENFFDVLGKMFLNELDAISQKGFYKKYVRKEENIKFLKGRLLFNEQMHNDIIKKPRFYCSYEDLTYDNLENRIILRAITLLIPLIKFSNKIKRGLLRYSNLLQAEEVSLVNVVAEECNIIQFSKLNEYYETIIQFSKVILQNYFIRSTGKGAAKGFNFIVNMNKVYEDFITELIEEVVTENSKNNQFKYLVVEKQERFNSLVREQKIITKPDVILRRMNTTDYPVLIDAKYRKQENNADYYQIIAYGLAIPTVKDCYLIYPSDEKDAETQTLTLEADKFGNSRGVIKLHSVKIDLLLNQNLNFDVYIKTMKEQLVKKLKF